MPTRLSRGRRGDGTKALLVCGILASLVYIGADVLAAFRYQGYSYTSQMVSELMAIAAPTRPLL